MQEIWNGRFGKDIFTSKLFLAGEVHAIFTQFNVLDFKDLKKKKKKRRLELLWKTLWNLLYLFKTIFSYFFSFWFNFALIIRNRFYFVFWLCETCESMREKELFFIELFVNEEKFIWNGYRALQVKRVCELSLLFLICVIRELLCLTLYN